MELNRKRDIEELNRKRDIEELNRKRDIEELNRKRDIEEQEGIEIGIGRNMNEWDGIGIQ